MAGLASSLDASLTLAPGSVLGRYCVLRRLAVGGMAELHLARILDSTEPNPFVVIKRVLPHLAIDPEFVKLFRNEAQISALLHHPNIVEVTEVAEIEDEFCYVMRYVHGQNLRSVLTTSRKQERMPLEVALTIIAAAARGLHHAHEQRGIDGRPLGLVHRDVSPSNILVGHDGTVRVADFGIAKAAARTERTRGSVMKGKIGYMSPEQCLGTRVDRRSDVFALGILLYETTTQSRLFWADGDFAILGQIVRGEFELPSERVPGYPPALEAIVTHALRTDPGERPPTAAALGRAIESFATDHGLALTSACVRSDMRRMFGEPTPPWLEFADADFVPPTRGVVASSMDARPRSRAGQSVLRWGALALALGGGVGLGASLRGDSNAAPAPDVVPAPAPSEAAVGSAAPEPVVEEPPATAEPPDAVEPPPSAPEATPLPAVNEAQSADVRKKAPSKKRRPSTRRSASPTPSPKSLFPDGF